MKDRQTSSAAEPPPSIPQLHQAHHQQHHRFVRKHGADDEAWRELPARGAADINLLANSLTTRLRKAARQKAAASNAASLAAARLASEFQDLEDADGSDEEKVQKSSKKKRSSHSQLAARRSILKRTVSNEMADRYRYSPDESLTSSSSVSDHHLPNVFGDRRLSASTGQLDQVGTRSENGKKSPGKKSSLAQVSNGVGAGGGSQGRGGYVSNGPVRLVKRAGIFIPVDKYAQGRQTLHGEDAPFGHHVPVDYETVTIRPGTPDSESVSVGGWSSGKSSRKKGLKVSWKSPSVAEDAPDQADARTEESSSPVRLRSASTTHSDGTAFSFSKPRFNSGKSSVPGVGVRWKVPVPNMRVVARGGGSTMGGVEGTKTVYLNDIPAHASPVSDISLPPAQPHNPNTKPPASRDPLHPWRALYPRDVHPVTTAMEREGTSVSKTMWHVPTRKAHAPTFIEDLLESKSHQWKPSMFYRMRANPMGASTPNQSMQVRFEGNPSSTDTLLLSSSVDNEQGNSCRSY